jgi:PAS domain S-box-containing protein
MAVARRYPYLVALTAAVVAAGVRLALTPVLHDDVPYLTFFAAVMTSAWYGGLPAGLAATAFSSVAAVLLFVTPRWSIAELDLADLVALGLFAVTGWLISAMSGRLHEARDGERLETERLRTTLHSIGDGVIVTNATGTVSMLNPIAERLTGWTTAEADGRSLTEVFKIVNEDTREPVDNPAMRALRDGEVVGVENHAVLVSRSGAEYPIDDSAAPVRNDNDRISGSVLVFRDVSERRRADAALRTSEQELTDFFENATVGLQWVSDDGVIRRANQAQLDLLGFPAPEYVGQHVSRFHMDADAIESVLERLRAGEVLHNLPLRLRCQDGAVKHAVISASGRWQNGRLTDSRWFTLDVTDRRRADEVRGLLAAVVESTEDAVISKALDGRILSWNAGAQAMFGYTPEEIVGHHVDLIVPEHLRPLEREFLDRVARAERVMPVETLRVAKDGEVLDVALTISPIRDPGGRIIGASSIARDIRGRKALEESLRESDRRKDEFLAVLAHELRNPLAPIRNGVAALRLALPDDRTLRSTGDIIERQVRQMARLLDDLLDVSRITHNKLDLRKEQLTLRTVLDAAQETCRPVVEAASQAISMTMPAAPIHLHGDPVRLAQVFSNLISNASKYSHPGATIRISAEVRGSEVTVSVADDGIGIQPEALPAIFEMFSQATQARTRAQGGIGIGLSLVRGLVELHGGRVSARSEGIGRGSTFEVRLPLGAGVAARPVADTDGGAERPVHRRVLIADDNRDGAESLAMVMTVFGCEVRTAYDGASAVRTAESFEPEVVFLDLGMPGMDGFEAARRIRSLPGGSTTVLIALTGWGQERDRQRTSEAGFDAHLVKPIDPLSMRSFLEQLPVAR